MKKLLFKFSLGLGCVILVLGPVILLAVGTCLYHGPSDLPLCGPLATQPCEPMSLGETLSFFAFIPIYTGILAFMGVYATKIDERIKKLEISGLLSDDSCYLLIGSR